ncbi:MAG: site-specific DNA-methyltransferase [Porticoccaceae bacterium]
MEKLKMHSPNLTDDNIARIREMFPGCVTEARGDDGSVKLAVDFDQLKQELCSSIVEGPQERYHLNWPGKREALLTANAPIAKTLRPVREESVDFDTTKNLFIEGDNLDALKLLQETYLGKIKMIYIDPPYNTGSDFIYADDFSENTEQFLIRSIQKDEDGNKLIANTESNGRFHSDWLSMIYPRIKLARHLLRDDGVIFVSIGDNEVHNLRRICDEIFGEKNFCAQFIWNTEGNTDNQYEVKVNHEYVISYYKDIEFSSTAIGCVVDPNTREDSNLWKGYADNNINKNSPENPPSIIELPIGFPSHEKDLFYPAKSVDEEFFRIVEKDKFISESVKNGYGIESKSGLPVKLDDMEVRDYKLTKPCRIFVGMANKNKLLEFISNKCQAILDEGNPLEFYINSNAAVRYRKQNDKPRNILSVLRNLGTTEKTKNYLRRMGVFYDYPKPVGLIEYLVKIGCESEGLIIDFFAGSGTTAEAVMSCNKDGKRRNYILVQAPEQLDPTKKEQKSAYDFCVSQNVEPNLAEISKERIRRVGFQIRESASSEGEVGDVGFRVLKVASSNMREVYYTPDELRQSQVDAFVDNIKPDRTPEDLLFQVMLDWGVDLALPIEKKAAQGKDVFFVDGNALAACFDAHSGVDEAFVKELATHKPLRVVFCDAGFADSAVKINVEQIFKLLSPATEVKCI